jgi:hypothetical protein
LPIQDQSFFEYQTPESVREKKSVTIEEFMEAARSLPDATWERLMQNVVGEQAPDASEVM